jgi:DNA-binding transcriptional LysR family regulator
MELRHLRYFVAVAEEQNITRAAARLHVSQPPLSRQIRDLEDELGVSLLDRGPQSVSLTDAGRVFFREAKAVLARAEAAIGAARAAGADCAGELRIGFAPSPTVEILPAALRAFRKSSPHAQARLHDMTSGEMQAGLRDGTLDVALTVQPPPRSMRGLHFEMLREYRVGVIVPRGHPLAKRRTTTIAEISSEPIVVFSRADYPDYHEWIASLLGGTTRKIPISAECDGVTSLLAAIESGRGVAILSENIRAVAGKRTVFIPLTPAPAPLLVGLLHRKQTPPPLVRKFLEAARKPHA